MTPISGRHWSFNNFTYGRFYQLSDRIVTDMRDDITLGYALCRLVILYELPQNWLLT